MTLSAVAKRKREASRPSEQVDDSIKRYEGPYVTAEIGRRITEQTVRTLQEREKQQPGTVGSVLVFFRQHQNEDDRRFLWDAPLTQWHREMRYTIARRSAARAQRETIDWLGNAREVRAAFRECPAFDFHPERDVRSFPVTNAMSIPATSDLVVRLSEFDGVLAVDTNEPLQHVPDAPRAALQEVVLLATRSTAAHRDAFTWGWHRLGLASIHAAGIRGRGIRFGLANTGVSDQAADLYHKVKDFAKVQPPNVVQPSYSFDPHWHGTHLAGILVGGGNSGVQIGGAPDAELTAVSVMDGESGWTSSLLAGLEWLADQYRSVSVVNLSVGIAAPTPERRLLLEDLFNELAQAGVVAVAAIGNRRQDSMYPAMLKNVIGVGALTPDDAVWPDSGRYPDLLAPGVSVYSCFPPGRPGLAGLHYGWCSGTSCAAAHVSAIAGLLIEARPSAGVRLIVEALIQSASLIEGPEDWIGNGVPDFSTALDYIDRFHMTPVPVP